MSKTPRSESIFSEIVLWLGLVSLVLFGLFTVIRFNTQDTSEQAIAAYKNQLRAYAQTYLEGARIEHTAYDSLSPNLLYIGKDAEVVYRSDITEDYNLSGRMSLRYSTLARTPAGRYFQLSYGVRLATLDECKRTPSDCDHIVRPHFMTLTEKGAKALIFHSPQFTPELYRGIFKEEPPAPTQQVPA